MESHDVIIIGAGQAGLAMGHHLAEQGMRFAILEAAPVLGRSWSRRWDSLKLFTPGAYSGLPGLAFPGDPDHFPARDEVVAYLQGYARTFDLPVRLEEQVSRLARVDGEGFEIATTGARTYHARQVVVATGPFQRPAVPRIGARVPPGVVQLHSSDYRRPEQLPPGEVLVVGAGNSGVQIAEELAATRPVSLAVGEALPRLPERLLGRSIFWWLERTGAMDLASTSWLGSRMREREALIGGSPRRVARRWGVRLLDRVVAADGDRLRTRRGETVTPAAIVWATGYRPDFAWIDAPVIGADGWPAHARGVTAVPGLYFLGLPWQHTRGSALIGWVGRDAAFLAERIAQRGRAPAAQLQTS